MQSVDLVFLEDQDLILAFWVQDKILIEVIKFQFLFSATAPA